MLDKFELIIKEARYKFFDIFTASHSAILILAPFIFFLRETYEEHQVIRKGNKHEGVRTGPTPVRTGQSPVRRGKTSVRRVFFVAIFPLSLCDFVT